MIPEEKIAWGNTSSNFSILFTMTFFSFINLRRVLKQIEKGQSTENLIISFSMYNR